MHEKAAGALRRGAQPGHHLTRWLLAFGFWLLAFGFWLLAFGFWLLVVGCSVGGRPCGRMCAVAQSLFRENVRSGSITYSRAGARSHRENRLN
ncbi:hypothetical protein B9Z33_01385 [Limnohabitans sp. T6-20]|nr:hypothetical protein B9Z33_01385 [Limnohabitans sp. T6-20]